MTDRIEGNRKSRRQCRKSADAGDDLGGERLAHILHPIEDTERAVVKPWIAPDEKRSGFIRPHTRDHFAILVRNRIVPIGDTGSIAGVFRVAHGQGEFHDTRRSLGETLDDLPPYRGQLRLILALGGHEEDIGRIERVYPFDRHVVGAAGADAYENDGAHAAVMAEKAPSVIGHKNFEGRPLSRARPIVR
jgi:hypothetical protein